MYVDLYQNLATKNNWKTKEVVIKRGLLAKMRAISDVVFLKMFLICKPRLLIFHNFQKLRKHNTSTELVIKSRNPRQCLETNAQLMPPLSWGGMRLIVAF